MSTEFPPALPHQDIQEIFPDVFMVTGAMQMGSMFRFNRNMIIVRHEGELTLVNTVRLDDPGLARLDELGEVKHVIKLGFFHDRDDGFYVDRYKATFWALPGHRHNLGLQADVEMEPDTELPIPGATLFVFTEVAKPEAVIHLDREGGILIACDALQNWARPGFGFNLVSKLLMRVMGFIKPANVGPGWRKYAKPQAKDFARLQALSYKHVLPAHGQPCKDIAHEEFGATFKRLFGV